MIADTMKTNLEEVRNNIARAAGATGRDAGAVTLVAVSKSVDPRSIQQMYRLGVHDFGENRVQEMQRKWEHLPQARWHMIGRLQTNKVKDLVGQAYLIQSLDRWNLAQEINRQGQRKNKEVQVLLQVNVARESSKTGLYLKEVPDFLHDIARLPYLKVCGLMTIAPIVDDAEETRPVFRELCRLYKKLEQEPLAHIDLRYLSMGMSQDYTVAIEEGSNMVRIGSALFA